jgi:hypothetical protein
VTETTDYQYTLRAAFNFCVALQVKIVKGQATNKVTVPENVTPFCCSDFFVHHDIQTQHETYTYKQKVP